MTRIVLRISLETDSQDDHNAVSVLEIIKRETSTHIRNQVVRAVLLEGLGSSKILKKCLNIEMKALSGRIKPRKISRIKKLVRVIDGQLIDTVKNKSKVGRPAKAERPQRAIKATKPRKLLDSRRPQEESRLLTHPLKAMEIPAQSAPTIDTIKNYAPAPLPSRSDPEKNLEAINYGAQPPSMDVLEKKERPKNRRLMW